MEKQKIQITIPATLRYSSLVRHMAEEVFSVVGFNKAWSSRLKLVVDELYMNAVRYGSLENKSFVFIEFYYDQESVEFIIEDSGTGSNKLSVEELKAKVESNASHTEVTNTSGRGLALIANLWTDKLDIESSSHGGIKISFSKHLETSPPPLPPMLQFAATVPKPSVPKSSTPEPKPDEKAGSQGPSFTLKLHGEIDQYHIDEVTAPVVQQIESMPEGATLILDFSDVQYINSTFIGNLAAWYNAASKKKGSLVLKNTNAQVQDVLDLVGLGHVLKLES